MLYPYTKQDFLKKLTSSQHSKYLYSRYRGLPLRYAGGKSLAVGHVVKHIPESTQTLISPFFGGGSVEIACVQKLNMKVIGYDIFDILVNYWQIQILNPNELANKISQWDNTKEKYYELKEILKQHWKQEKIINDKTELAALYWFSHNLSYGPGFLGWMSKNYLDRKVVDRSIERVRNFKADGLSVIHDSFENVIPKHNKEFLYCDPPYYLGGDSKMFKGIYPQRNFPVHHNGFNHEKLRDLLYNHKGGFILSYNDCKIIRDWYNKFDIHEVEWQHTLGQGETRIGKNRLERGDKNHVKKSHEILIVG